MHLTLVRHGQSVGNARRLFSGTHDHPLTPHGIEQADRLGLWLADTPYDVLFTSRLSRAIETAAVVVARLDHKPAETIRSDRITEKSHGVLENQPRDGLGPDYWTRYTSDVDLCEDEGESPRRCYERVAAFCDDTLWPRLDRGDRVLVVAHGWVNAALMAHLHGLGPAGIFQHRFGNAVAATVTFAGRTPAATLWSE